MTSNPANIVAAQFSRNFLEIPPFLGNNPPIQVIKDVSKSIDQLARRWLVDRPGRSLYQSITIQIPFYYYSITIQIS
jgi:hypothetical protein